MDEAMLEECKPHPVESEKNRLFVERTLLHHHANGLPNRWKSRNTGGELHYLLKKTVTFLLRLRVDEWTLALEV
jgi:hypothetical protein